jgi:hypothetical protein
VVTLTRQLAEAILFKVESQGSVLQPLLKVQWSNLVMWKPAFVIRTRTNLLYERTYVRVGVRTNVRTYPECGIRFEPDLLSHDLPPLFFPIPNACAQLALDSMCIVQPQRLTPMMPVQPKEARAYET